MKQDQWLVLWLQEKDGGTHRVLQGKLRGKNVEFSVCKANKTKNSSQEASADHQKPINQLQSTFMNTILKCRSVDSIPGSQLDPCMLESSGLSNHFTQFMAYVPHWSRKCPTLVYYSIYFWFPLFFYIPSLHSHPRTVLHLPQDSILMYLTRDLSMKNINIFFSSSI